MQHRTDILTIENIQTLARALITYNIPIFAPLAETTIKPVFGIYGVPRGGIPAALAVSEAFASQFGRRLPVISDPTLANIIIDDIIDSGRTKERYNEKYPETPFLALIDQRQTNLFDNPWYVFPWEETEDKSVEDSFIRLLQFIGEDPSREGLLDTPTRAARAWREWTSGYNIDPTKFLTTFTDGSQGYNELVLIKNIPFYSHCEHHLAPFFGTVSVAYIPTDKIIGLSKIPRIVETYARRLQVQERLTTQIARCVNDLLSPMGVAVLMKARHLCMESRGISQQGHETVTCALHGVFMDKPEARAEFMQAVK